MTTSLLLIAAALLAQAPDAETRFHDAYLAEVVDGKVAEAARTYVDLMEDDAAPAAVRRESRFRFAVCCVLLGRADEARARLAEILADPETPEAMRARVEEYRKAVGEIGVGTETDRRLQELVFELGRTTTNQGGIIPVYRDFQIIGKPAVPFLRRLLLHPDDLLRQHAFRILCRMGEPGMVEHLDPAWLANQFFGVELRVYLSSREDQRDRLNERLLGLDDDRLLLALDTLNRIEFPFPSAFARDIASREGFAGAALGILRRNGFGDFEMELLARWIREGNGELAREAAKQLTSVCGSNRDLDEHATPELFPVVVERLTGAWLENLPWRGHGSTRRNLSTRSWGLTPHSLRGFQKYARTVPRETRLEVLERLVQVGTEWKEDSTTNPLWNGLADAIATTLDEEAGPGDVQDYAKLLRRWAATPTTPDEIHFMVLFRKLDEDAAAELAVWLYTDGPAKAEPSPARWARTLHVKSARDARVLLRLLPEIAEGKRADLLAYQLGVMERTSEVAEVVVPALPELVAMLPEKSFRDRVGRLFQDLSPLAPTETAVDVMMALFDVARARAGDALQALAVGLYGFSHGDATDYRIRVAIPALSRAWAALDGRNRSRVLNGAMWFLSEDRSGQAPLGAAREALAEFLLAHVEDLGSNVLPLLQSPDLFPPETWVYRVKGRGAFSSTNAQNALPRERADAAARALAEDPEKLTESALSFIRSCTDPEVQREILDGLLAGDDLAKLERAAAFVDASTGYPATPEALEGALERLLAHEDADLAPIARLGEILAVLRPSEKLFPAARRLIHAENRVRVQEGVDLAKRLGHPALLPDLVTLLDSLDQGVRTAAKDAMDSILELRRIRQEAKERIVEEGRK